MANRPDPKVIEADWRARQFSFGIWTDPPGQVWEDFVHGEDELFMLYEGEVELELAGKRSRPKVGEEVLITAGVKHSVRNLGHKSSRWFYGYKRSE